MKFARLCYGSGASSGFLVKNKENGWSASINYFDSFDLDAGSYQLVGEGASPYEAVKDLEKQLVSKEIIK